MIKRALAALTAILLGCEAAPVPVAPPQPAALLAPAKADLPFLGTYPRQALSTFKNGKRTHVANRTGQGSLRITESKATFEQTYDLRGEPMRVVQVYSYGPKSVEPVGDEGWDVLLTFESIDGQGQSYSPDSGHPMLIVRRRAYGWQVTLMTLDTSQVMAATTFGAEPPDQPDEDIVGYARRVGVVSARGRLGDITAPADVAAAPTDAPLTPSGLASKVLVSGTGQTHPDPLDTVKVHYTGWTTDGEMFDSSLLRDEPASFKPSQVVKGFAEGLALMVTGEKRRLWIPAALAYGKNPRMGAPGGDLVFDVELLEIVPGIKPPPVPEDVAAPPKNARKTRSGLAYRVLKKSQGKRSPKASDTVSVSYSGWTTDGKMFDSSVTRGERASFPLQHVIKGWTEGVQLMKEGEVTRFWIPADLAYGEKPSRPGTPTGMLVFDIELHAIE